MRSRSAFRPHFSFALMLLLGMGWAAVATAQIGHATLRIHREKPNGSVSFLVPGPGANTIGTPRGLGRTEAEDLLVQHGALFGITDVASQLVEDRTRVDPLGHVHTSFVQYERGIPVFGGEIRVHQNARRAFTAANGRFRAIDADLSPQPDIAVADAVEIAAALLVSRDPIVDRAELTWVDPGWYGDLPMGTRLAYHIELTDLRVPESLGFFVDAHSGEILDRWSQLHWALDREVIQGGAVARDEGDPVTGDPEIDGAYDFAAHAYNYFSRGHGRDSYDALGSTLTMVTNHGVGCPNAFWSDPTQQTYYCFGMVTDDILAHEIAHGVTYASSRLFYQNESGQLNESFSDVFGELVDLFNGDAAFAGVPGGTPWDVLPGGSGTDTPNNARTACSPSPANADGVRWLIAEDTNAGGAFNGAIRDMWDPTCFGHPDKASSPLQTCFPYDFGGVHSGSGIPNHAFAILTDGKTFNGQTVTGIGPIKAAAVWYRAYTSYLVSASNFGDFAVALNQAATDLTNVLVADPRPGGGTVLFTAADAAEVAKVVMAVELDLPGGTCTLGACCNALGGTCGDNVNDAQCSGVFHPGRLCSSLSPTCTRPSDTARMVVVLDRSGSMSAVRGSTGNSRCIDAIAAAKIDVKRFFKKHPMRSVSIRLFAATTTTITAGFVDEATALAALDSLSNTCGGGTALAEAICAAIDDFPGGLGVHDKVISLNTDGDEGSSGGVCAGPASVTVPPPPGNYSPGSWQEAVYNRIDGQVIALIRNWTNFGGIDNQINPETSMPYGAGAAADNIFLQDFAGVSGGAFAVVTDDDPLPAAFLIDATGAPGLSGVALAVTAASLGLYGQRWLRRRGREKSGRPPEGSPE